MSHRFQPNFYTDKKFFTKSKEQIKAINLQTHIPRGGIRL